MQTYKLIVVRVSDEQFDAVAVFDLDFIYQYTLDLHKYGRPFSKYDYEHGLSRTQKSVQRMVDKAKERGIDFILFERRS